MLNTRGLENLTLSVRENFFDSGSSFEHEQIGFCGILEDYSSFRTRERVVIKL